MKLQWHWRSIAPKFSWSCSSFPWCSWLTSCSWITNAHPHRTMKVSNTVAGEDTVCIIWAVYFFSHNPIGNAWFIGQIFCSLAKPSLHHTGTQNCTQKWIGENSPSLGVSELCQTLLMIYWTVCITDDKCTSCVQEGHIPKSQIHTSYLTLFQAEEAFLVSINNHSKAKDFNFLYFVLSCGIIVLLYLIMRCQDLY